MFKIAAPLVELPLVKFTLLTLIFAPLATFRILTALFPLKVMVLGPE